MMKMKNEIYDIFMKTLESESLANSIAYLMGTIHFILDEAINKHPENKKELINHIQTVFNNSMERLKNKEPKQCPPK